MLLSSRVIPNEIGHVHIPQLS